MAYEEDSAYSYPGELILSQGPYYYSSRDNFGRPIPAGAGKPNGGRNHIGCNCGKQIGFLTKSIGQDNEAGAIYGK